MKVTTPYNYPALKRTNHNGKRHYVAEGKKLPSVTTILDCCTDKSFLYEWRERVGKEEADKITNRSANVGSKLHKIIEDYIVEGKKPKGNPLSVMMASAIINKGLKKIDEVWGCEVALYYPGLYAGTADMVAVHNGDAAIVDFKNAKSFKKEEWIESYFCQLVAYAHAHNQIFNTNINKGVIMLATHDGQYQEFILEGDKFEQFSVKWAKFVEEYFDHFNR